MYGEESDFALVVLSNLANLLVEVDVRVRVMVKVRGLRLGLRLGLG